MIENSLAKLSAPRATGILTRPRVIAMIERCLESGLCWIAAPGGYGKSTAVVDFLSNTGCTHVWFRADEGDRDIARFFHYLGQTLPMDSEGADLPSFVEEYAEQPRDFARLFSRAFFARLEPGTLIVLDDLHHADCDAFQDVLSVMLRELPAALSCICLSRKLPHISLDSMVATGRMNIVRQSDLEFTDEESEEFVVWRMRQAARRIDPARARGWALGLVMLTDRQPALAPFRDSTTPSAITGLFSALGRELFEGLSQTDQDMLLKLSLLPEISVELADVLTGTAGAEAFLERLYNRQLLVLTAGDGVRQFHLHDLLRDFLNLRFAQRFTAAERSGICREAALVLRDAGRSYDAVPLALRAEDWALAREIMLERAEPVLADGGRSTLINWAAQLPDEEFNAWLCYWLGVAHIPDDAAAERWLDRAWHGFEAEGDLRGQCLTVARAVLVKTNSWRTYQDMSNWTRRAIGIIESGLPTFPGKDDLIVCTGMIRALDFAEHSRSDSPAADALVTRLLDWLEADYGDDPGALRLSASESLIEHSITSGRTELFAKAVDSVVQDVSAPEVSRWVLGSWLVVFGAAWGRYFAYAHRDLPYGSAEDVLRAAISIGERDAFRNLEFGGLYHLQIIMKMRNDFVEFQNLVERLAEIADSRFTTQVAVVADCRAALYARQGDFEAAHRECNRFMAAIEEAGEPMIERWPHFITKFQVLLAERRPLEAIALLKALLQHLDGGLRARTALCILAAEALDAKWAGAPRYPERLSEFITELRKADWPSVLVNLPELLAEFLADALQARLCVDYCRSLIRERALKPPENRPEDWPWALRVHVLGGFRLADLNGEIHLGSRPPTRALDILRALALSKELSVSTEILQDSLWPDLDGDQAKAAFDQALHRLRRLLGRSDLVMLQHGKLSLPSELVWVDVAEWEDRCRVLGPSSAADTLADLDTLFEAFSGPPMQNEHVAGWQVPVIERVRNRFIDLAVRLAGLRTASGDALGAKEVYLRATEHYPYSARLYEGLISVEIAQGDVPGAIADYSRFERNLSASGRGAPPRAVRKLIAPTLAHPGSHSKT